ncbi:acetoacetate decarboxylase family protein [Haloechinothrix halophila]|uniref:acetoacetate decarboxylase family protein n=1 Tax=Haloechinothrix halophila TaxID=1069073 RepID=UPI000418BC0B|nr:acetoacetate decarboxylase family protein [Haloechinothrix halophila]
MTEQTYPPEPWTLCGDAFVSVWRLPEAELPALPDGVEPITVAGTGVVVTAWVDYQEPGVLSYRELMATVAVRDGARPAASITHIWVDSETSLAGGRELWRIPKDMAKFELTRSRAITATAHIDHGPIAGAAFVPVATLPIAVPSAFAVIQRGPLRSPVRVAGKPVLVRSSWWVDADGPLGFLHGRKPLASMGITGFEMRFGTDRG